MKNKKGKSLFLYKYLHQGKEKRKNYQKVNKKKGYDTPVSVRG
jgi:hypothetical protein